MSTISDHTSPQGLCVGCGASLESPIEIAVNTAVNTANPSRAPSLHGGSGDDSKLEEGLTSKEIGAEDSDEEAEVARDLNMVACDGPDDPENPMNFSRTKKWFITMITALLTFCVSFASSIFSTATFATADEFGVSAEVMILGVSLYVLGFACGE
jgi:DHA1 family multidrug resistance protein-like MFS transporter